MNRTDFLGGGGTMARFRRRDEDSIERVEPVKDSIERVELVEDSNDRVELVEDSIDRREPVLVNLLEEEERLLLCPPPLGGDDDDGRRGCLFAEEVRVFLAAVEDTDTVELAE